MIILKPSTIHGIGSFTDSLIKKDEEIIFWDSNDIATTRLISKKTMNDSDGICIDSGEDYICPVNFKKRIGYYVNYSTQPNIIISDGAYKHVALKDILPGEELTMDYA